MIDQNDRGRLAYIYTLVICSLTTVFSLADPPQGLWQILFHIVLPISLVIVSGWQLIKLRRD